MATYYRIKEITGPTGIATVLRQGNLLSIDLGDFIYPDEVETIACEYAVIYFDDNTGEHFTWEPNAPKAEPKAPAKQPEAPAAE